MEDMLKKEYDALLKDGYIEGELYDRFKVKRGLRNDNGTGVLVGLTKVADVDGYTVENDVKVPTEGKLFYRGIEIKDIVNHTSGFSYENTCFLLLFGHYPNKAESQWFRDLMAENYDLPDSFIENIIMKNPSKSLMNHITRSILSLYSFDDDPDNIDPYEVIKKGISLIAKMPAIISYSLQAKTHYLDHDSLHIHFPKKEFSFAENILYLSRNDGRFTAMEAQILDTCLMVHADHGGGNNSAFVGTVVASTLTDLYSMVAASLTSLKGPRHGGANIANLEMMNLAIDEIGLSASDDEIIGIINRILDKDFYDNKGLIYGIGHAVYTISDPRCDLLRKEAQRLAKSRGSERFDFYYRFEKLAIKVMKERKGISVCANMDYYSGLIYDMLGIPRDLFIPLFAAARTVGWISHDIESLLYCNKIIRPATKYVGNLEKTK